MSPKIICLSSTHCRQYGKLFEFNMVGAAGRLLGVGHKSGTIVVLILDDGGKSCSTLSSWRIERR
jgi:hypothetical protein